MTEDIYQRVQAVLLDSQDDPRDVVAEAHRALVEFAAGEDVLDAMTLKHPLKAPDPAMPYLRLRQQDFKVLEQASGTGMKIYMARVGRGIRIGLIHRRGETSFIVPEGVFFWFAKSFQDLITTTR